MKHKMHSGLVTGLLIAVLFSACKKDDNNGNNGGNHGDEETVGITNFSFSPSPVTIAKNVTVTWTNNDTAPHTVTADDNSFASPTLQKGDTYSHKFTSTGTVAYHCEIHPMMTGSVVVQ